MLELEIYFEFENYTGIPHEDSAWIWRLTKIIAQKENEKIEINILIIQGLIQIV